MAHMAPYRHPSGPLDPPPTAKKRRKNAAPQPPPTQVPTIQDLLPPAPQGYGDTVIASNPFDDTPQIWAHRPHPMGGPPMGTPMGRSPMGPMSPMMGPISPYSPMVHSPMGGSPHLMGGGSPLGMPRGPPMGINNNSCQMGPVRSPQMGLRQSPVSSMGGCPPTSQAITTNAQSMGPPPMNFNNSCQMSGPPMGSGMGIQMVGGFQGGKSLSAGKVYPSDQPMVFNPQNPNAPPIYPCGVCHKEVHDNDQAILCESGCNFWFHRSCTGLTEGAYHLLTAEVYAEWVCDKCLASKHIPLVKFKP